MPLPVNKKARECRTPPHLAALAKVERLPAESALVDAPVVGAAEGQPVVLQLHHGLGGLAAHVLDGVLWWGEGVCVGLGVC